MHLSRSAGDEWQYLGPTPGGGFVTYLSLAPLFQKWGVGFAEAGGVIFRSADGGAHWSPVLNTEGMTARDVIFVPAMETDRPVFLVATVPDPPAGADAERGALYRSTDGGLSWQALPLDNGEMATALALSPNFGRDGLLLVGTAGGNVVSVPVAALLSRP